MTIEITDGTVTTEPLLVLGYSHAQTSNNILHRIIGRPEPDVTLMPASLRQGTMTLLYDSVSAAEGARELLATEQVFTYTDSEVAEMDMDFVCTGVRVDQDETRAYWLVGVDFEQVG